MSLFDSLDELIFDLEICCAEPEELPEPVKSSLHQLRKRRNALAPLCRMPLDVLAHIFGLLEFVTGDRVYQELGHPDDNIQPDDEDDGSSVESDHVEYVDDTLKRDSLKEVRYPIFWEMRNITRICSYLRTVILSLPSLWSVINCTHLKSASHLWLKRARLHPLSVTCEWREKNAHMHSLVSSMMRQARELELTLIPEKVDPNGSLAHLPLDQPLPLLTSLRLDVYQRSLHFEFSSGFLAGATQSLTRLVLNCVHLAPDIISLPSLVHLDLRGLRGGYELKHVFGLISHAPGLRNICLASLRCQAPHPTVIFDPITLPDLERTMLCDQIVMLDALSSVLPLPQCSYQLTCMSGWHDRRDRHILGPARVRLCERIQLLFSNSSTKYDTYLHSDRMSIYLITRGLNAGAVCERFVFLDRSSDSIKSLGPSLNLVKQIRVHDSAVRDLFEYAAQRPHDRLSLIEDIMIQNWKYKPQPEIEPELQELIVLMVWLGKLAATGRRIRILDFRSCQDMFSHCGGVTQVIQDVSKHNVVDYILVDGQVFDS
jgi:hypothetical protein